MPIHPEYHQLPKTRVLLKESRMDAVAVLQPDGTLDVRELRRLEVGDRVACGRGEHGEDGIYVHTEAFGEPQGSSDKFAFRTRLTRETAFSIDYDELYELLAYERTNGFILWVLGPAAVFDTIPARRWRSSGAAMQPAGRERLAAHDIEGALRYCPRPGSTPSVRYPGPLPPSGCVTAFAPGRHRRSHCRRGGPRRRHARSGTKPDSLCAGGLHPR
jgi:hypothetical protein